LRKYSIAVELVFDTNPIFKKRHRGNRSFPATSNFYTTIFVQPNRFGVNFFLKSYRERNRHLFLTSVASCGTKHRFFFKRVSASGSVVLTLGKLTQFLTMLAIG